jgi:hypothetical protein
MLVSVRLCDSVLWETEQSEYFLLQTCSFECSVMLKIAVAHWSITVLIIAMSFKTLAKAQSHITLLVLEFNYFVFNPSHKTNSAAESGGRIWPVTAKVTSSRVTCFSETQGLPRHQHGRVWHPALSVKFRTSQSQKYLWVILVPHEVNSRKLFRIFMSKEWKNNFFCPLPCLEL